MVIISSHQSVKPMRLHVLSMSIDSSFSSSFLDLSSVGTVSLLIHHNRVQREATA
jgi:hypothetical protein